ncbi:DNA ligase D [Gaiella sp.]|jgi:bifunctional non-homologous end joining protein LigD|uniref:DNA ligase D n=1 Tax=Gaiella sp. TaxID=2663207 RepID=UPI002E313658|nr:DNA ligase D [Gaiella sp.]HEX5585052.1 DNA ligase D [Gaiella sp.]
MAQLGDYRRKRDPARTPEPFGGKRGDGRPLFVIQRHDARRLHYDLRLERHGALASWAVPKGLPLHAGERHLAVHVEDHPLDYGSFEGEIPQGQYGAGTVEIWDRGTYELLEEKRDGGLTFRLEGSRARGVWTLVPAHLDGKEQNWLLLRKDAPPAAEETLAPQLAELTESLPTGDDWLFEPKWDGYRAIVTVSGGDARLTSRNGKDLTERFGDAARAAAKAVRTPSAVLDGEVVALDDDGAARFEALQRGSGRLVLIAFDLLELDGEPIWQRPLRERRERLEGLLDPTVVGVRVSPAFEDGAALLDVARAQGLEGVVAKRADLPYRPGRRTSEWRKLKLRAQEDFPIVGYTRGEGRRAKLGALVLGRQEADGLQWAGNVGSGIADGEVERLLVLLEPLRRTDAPLVRVPKMPRVRMRDVTWVEPALAAEVTYAEKTREGRLRAPVYLGVRDDVPVERPPIDPEIRRGRRTLRLSNLDKPFWPDEGITKGELLAYYRDVADVLVPHLRKRPFTMKRYPDGWQGKSFFQKQAPSHMPDWIERAPFPASTREGEKKVIDYALIDDELALLWAVNMGCIDMHAWASRADRPERPDWVMFDLDPSEGAGFEDVIEVALLVRQALDLVELESVPKTSGSRGIHVLVPIARRHDFAAVREFAGIVAGALARAHPGLVTTEWTKAKRKGVLVDANQNGPGKTTASVYSVRPRAGAPVSTPLRWDEVEPGLDPLAFTMDVVLERVEREGDLFARVLGGGQSLGAALRALR